MLTVAALSPSLDLTFQLDRLRLGQIHRTSDVVRCAGGKPLNMARAASTMGADVRVVALLGGATGDALAGMLRTDGLSVVVVRSPAETRTCISVAADTESLTEIYQEAPAVPDEVWQQYRVALEAELAGSHGWLSISGQAPLGSSQLIAELVRLSRRYGLRVAVDSHGPALPEAVAERPALVKVNRLEAAELLGEPVDTDLRRLAEGLRVAAGALVVLTDGVAGAVAVDDSIALRAEIPELRGRFAVGSGDAFLGGLLTVLDSGGGLEQALRTATACGVANALVPGPGLFTSAAVAEIAPQVRIVAARG